MSWLEALYLLFLGIMLAQAWLNLRLSLYAWEEPDRQRAIRVPERFQVPKYSFTVVIPALNEADVIGATLSKVAEAKYPSDLLQILVLCRHYDQDTIAAAQAAIKEKNIPGAQIVTYYGDIPGKPVQLNQSLKLAKNDLFVIFDAEDDMHPDIFNVANTVFSNRPHVGVLQSGVQLMDYASHWYSAHNVLEYFFWYKSRMHFHAKLGVVPLGGNTVFFRTSLLNEVNGWRDDCLTEDADIGIRLSAKGVPIATTYDARFVTRESVPPTAGGFVKQRTRWVQGFIQVLRYKDWKAYPLLSQRLWALYILGFSIFQAILFVISPLFLGVGLTASLPVWITMFSFLPLLFTLMLIAVQLVGLNEFIRDQHLRHRVWVYALFPLTFLMYQVLLNVAVLRAFWREVTKRTDWEKTAHLNIHRTAVEPTMAAAETRS